MATPVLNVILAVIQRISSEQFLSIRIHDVKNIPGSGIFMVSVRLLVS